MNQFTIIGNLTKELTMYTTTKDKSFTFLLVAVNSTNGKTDFLSIKVWGDLAESCVETLKKGDKVKVAGRITMYVDESKEQRQYNTVLVGDSVGRIAKPARDKVAVLAIEQ